MGEDATIIGRRITVIGDAVGDAVMVMVVIIMAMAVAVVEAAVLRADKQATHIGQGNKARTDPDHYHPPRRRQSQILQPNPSILALEVRQTIRHTPHNCNNNLALHNRIRRCRSRMCHRKSNRISTLGSRNSLV